MIRIVFILILFSSHVNAQWREPNIEVRQSPTPDKDSVFVLSSSSRTDLINGFGEWSASVLPYKVYTALVNQSGTNAPVPNTLQNTTGVTPYWYKDNPNPLVMGGYSVRFDGITSTNVFVIMPQYEINNQFAFDYGFGIEDGDLIVSFHCYDAASNGGVIPYDLINGAFIDTPIEIRIYP